MIKKIIMSLNKQGKSSEQYIADLRRRGVTVGEGTCFYAPASNFVDVGKGKYIKIGSKCKITRGVVILAHDFSYSVLNEVYGVLPQNTAMTIIGNNVFIGMNAIVLMGSQIGDNVIIGAGAVVSGEVESNSVYGGNPARKICSLDEYYKKHMQRFEASAIIQAKRIKEVTGRIPTDSEMEFYAQLYSNDSKFYQVMPEQLGVAPKKIPKQTKYHSLEEFLNHHNI